MSVLQKRFRFIDRTNMSIDGPGTDAMQRYFYNGNKRNHSLKFQALKTLG